MENKKLTNSQIKAMLYEGQLGHSKLFHHFNKDDYIITSLMGSEGYHWNEQTKLWEEFNFSTILSDVSDFLCNKILNLDKKYYITDISDDDNSSDGSSDSESNDSDSDDDDDYKRKKLKLKLKQLDKDKRIKEKLKKEKLRQKHKEQCIKTHSKILKQCQSVNHCENVLKFCKKDFFDPDFMNKLNSSPNLLPIRDGKIIDLKTLKIRDRIRSDYFTYSLDVSTTKDYSHAERFFNQLMCNDKEKLDYFQIFLVFAYNELCNYYYKKV